MPRRRFPNSTEALAIVSENRNRTSDMRPAAGGQEQSALGRWAALDYGVTTIPGPEQETEEAVL
jgi:hypothetical protein